MIKKLSIAIACVTMSGCSFLSVGSGEYACKGYDTEGVTCMSALEVYEATENRTSISNSDFKDGESKHEGRAAQRHNSESHADGRPTTQQHRSAGQYIRHTGPTPIRTPARVMRIWLDTYEDKQGDLHSPGLVYTEVESRRWNIGRKAPQRANKIRPLGLQSSNLKPTQQQLQQPGNGTSNSNPNVSAQAASAANSAAQ